MEERGTEVVMCRVGLEKVFNREGGRVVWWIWHESRYQQNCWRMFWWHFKHERYQQRISCSNKETSPVVIYVHWYLLNYPLDIPWKHLNQYPMPLAQYRAYKLPRGKPKTPRNFRWYFSARWKLKVESEITVWDSMVLLLGGSQGCHLTNRMHSEETPDFIGRHSWFYQKTKTLKLIQMHVVFCHQLVTEFIFGLFLLREIYQTWATLVDIFQVNVLMWFQHRKMPVSPLRTEWLWI